MSLVSLSLSNRAQDRCWFCDGHTNILADGKYRYATKERNINVLGLVTENHNCNNLNIVTHARSFLERFWVASLSSD